MKSPTNSANAQVMQKALHNIRLFASVTAEQQLHTKVTCLRQICCMTATIKAWFAHHIPVPH